MLGPIATVATSGHAEHLSYIDPLLPNLPPPAATNRPPAGASVRTTRHLDPDARTWIDDLGGTGSEHEPAIEALHDLLLKAARFEVDRLWTGSPLGSADRDELAHESADDALVAVLSKLDQFHGESRFTTWAYKFALLEAGVKLRRRAWRGREIPLEPAGRPLIANGSSTPPRDLETTELITALREAIEHDLSPRQRQVLIATTLNDVPIDVLAERLDTTRGALYDTIHDARHKLREGLAARGLSAGEHPKTTG